MKEYEYKKFIIVKNGTRKFPYNIYLSTEVKLFGELRKSRDWMGYGDTIKDCKCDIDNGCFD